MITSETFFEDVRIPADALFGEENRGWYYMTNALDLERVMIEPYSLYQRRVDNIVGHLKAQRPDLLGNPVVRTKMAEAAVDGEISRALAMTNAIMVQNGITPTMEGAMVKAWGSEARYRIDSLGMDLLGNEAVLQRDSPDAPLRGVIEEEYRGSSVHRFAGGTNDVLRRIIATRGLGLPRG
jgi:alkylation response protein AidB-like acyl-CoA dehydrogenase